MARGGGTLRGSGGPTGRAATGEDHGQDARASGAGHESPVTGHGSVARGLSSLRTTILQDIVNDA